jgi:poly-gamma-glutamate synthesis protein (capsule biosynthesis protein)
LPDFSPRTAERIAERIAAQRLPGDLVVVSVHWGGNWGYGVPRAHRDFAHALVDAGAADVVHGHSSHHRKAIEVYCGRPILYGCGDFINDYEGIGGYEEFRADLVLAYFVTLDASSRELAWLSAVPFRLRRFRLERASRDDADWLRQVMDREGGPFGTATFLAEDGTLELQW